MNEQAFYCIYSGSQHPDSDRSLEHIIPFALGGTGQFGTKDVSAIANSRVGTIADAPLINHPLVTIERWRLKIPGQSGRIPGIEFRGTIDIEGSPVSARYLINHDGTVELTTLPDVRSDWANRTFQVSCDPMDLQGILENIIDKGKKKGLAVSLDAIRTESVRNTRIERPELSTQMSMGLFDLVPGFTKMALGTGHFLFGESWSQGHDADLLRAVINEKDSQKRLAVPVHGQVWPNTPLHDVMSSNCFIDHDKHVIVVWNQKPVGFYALLFGRFDGFVQLAETPLRNAALAPGSGIVYVFCCKTRQVVSFDWQLFLTRQMMEKGMI